MPVVGVITRPQIHYDGRIVRIGAGPPALWFLAPDLSVMGETYGKNLRGMGSLAVAGHWEHGPALLVLSGDAPSDIPACDALVWLNPPAQIPPAQISPQLRRLVENASRKTIAWGALRSDANPRELRGWFETLPNARWVVVPGRGKYLGDVLDGAP